MRAGVGTAGVAEDFCPEPTDVSPHLEAGKTASRTGLEFRV